MAILGTITSVKINGVEYKVTDSSEFEFRSIMEQEQNQKAKPLTSRQRDTYVFVMGYIKQHGKAPTFQEVANFFGVSVHAADMRLRQCRDRGLIEWTKNKPRSIKVLREESESKAANAQSER